MMFAIARIDDVTLRLHPLPLVRQASASSSDRRQRSQALAEGSEHAAPY